MHIYLLERPMLPMHYSIEPGLLHIPQPQGFLPTVTTMHFPILSGSFPAFYGPFWLQPTLRLLHPNQHPVASG
jgi:hypothetical protein